MTSIVFVGPTLAPEEVAAAGDFICLPPVSQGDVYRAARSRPRAIGIIDGYFSGAPSVWHKEILWAISEGVPVFGSASMGALRAAELHSFGMRGVGRIFEAFRDGVLEDDDEVAVLHGPAEIGYLAASEPMVNIRETLALARDEGGARAGFPAVARKRSPSPFFSPSAIGRSCWRPRLRTASPKPRWSRSRGLAADGARGSKAIGRLGDARGDAGADRGGRAQAPVVSFRVDLFMGSVRRPVRRRHGVSSPSARRILDELRIEGPDAYGRVETRALLRMVAAKAPLGRPSPRVTRRERC